MNILEETNKEIDDDIPFVGDDYDASFIKKKNNLMSSLMINAPCLWRFGAKKHYKDCTDMSSAPPEVFQLRKDKYGNYENGLSLYKIHEESIDHSLGHSLNKEGILFFKLLRKYKILNTSNNDRAVSLLKESLFSNITDIDILNCFSELEITESDVNEKSLKIKHWEIKNIPKNEETISGNPASKKQIIETTLAKSSKSFVIKERELLGGLAP